MCGVAYVPLAQQEVFPDVATRPNETATPPHQPAGDHEPAMQCLQKPTTHALVAGFAGGGLIEGSGWSAGCSAKDKRRAKTDRYRVW